MGSYKEFSFFYDALTSDVNYKCMAKYLLSLFRKHDKKPTLLLDMACGTGNLSFLLAKEGISVIGVDASEEMLSVANEKKVQSDSDVMFICQKAEELDLYGTVDGAICCLDSLNHITDYKTFSKALKKIALFLEKDRLFIFDLNTEHKHQSVLSDNTFVKEIDNIYCVWQNTYKPKKKLTEISLDIFEKTGNSYNRFTEQFCERAYTADEVEKSLLAAGLKIEAVYHENSFDEPKSDTQRVVYVTRKV